MLIASFPLAVEFLAAGPLVHSMSFLPVFHVVAVVSASIWPLIHTVAMQLIIGISALIDPTVRPGVHTLAVHLVFVPLPVIRAAIFILTFAISVPLGQFKIPNVP